MRFIREHEALLEWRVAQIPDALSVKVEAGQGAEIAREVQPAATRIPTGSPLGRGDHDLACGNARQDAVGQVHGDQLVDAR